MDKMTNLDKVTIALSEWAYNVAASVLPHFSIPAGSAVGRFMYGILGTDPASYNVWKELGFLAEPLIQTVLAPMLAKALGGVPDEQIPELAKKFAESFAEQARKAGSVNVFGLDLGPKAFEGFRAILAEKLE